MESLNEKEQITKQPVQNILIILLVTALDEYVYEVYL